MPKAAGITAHGSVLARAASSNYSLEKTTSGRQAIVSTSVSSPLTDGLKFRIVQRSGRHYFKQVRFKCDKMTNAEAHAVAEFFEGRCLENLSRESLSACFGRTPLLHGLQDLVADLQHILCE
jgi:hypothetical protein